MLNDTCSRGGLLELRIEDLYKNKIFSSTQDKDKNEFQFKVELMMEFDPRCKLLEYVSNSKLVLIPICKE